MNENDTVFAWLIEAPGLNYLGARKIGCHHHFYWTTDHDKALRFFSQEQADAAMMAVREAAPSLWAFAVNLGEARPVEHAWISPASHPAPAPPQGRATVEAVRCSVCDDIVEIDNERIRQEERGFLDTPGGFEHMGDVWNQISKWADAIRALRAAPPAPFDKSGERRDFEEHFRGSLIAADLGFPIDEIWQGWLARARLAHGRG